MRRGRYVVDLPCWMARPYEKGKICSRPTLLDGESVGEGEDMQ